MAPEAPFRTETLRYLADLKVHNDRAWFEAHRDLYERWYRDAFVGFIAAFGERLPRISEHLVADARPSGGSVMRIYRDVRFAKDKTPYRTFTVVHFMHEDGGEGRAPGLFLYVAPDEVTAGGGLWNPEPAVAARIRAAIAEDPAAWKKATRSLTFRRRFGLIGESLKRVPSGLPAIPELADDLRRKSFVAETAVPITDFTARDFLARYETIARGVAPLLGFLCDAVGLPF